jgi:phenylpropionate dioxygenase-like ring-hydroxylating dioxygenase large terminal subunit
MADDILLCEEGAVRMGEIHAVSAAGRKLCLTRLEDRRVVAFQPSCPHRHGPLWAGKVSDGCVVCPWHGFKFELDGGRLHGAESIMHLKTYPVMQAQGQLWLAADALSNDRKEEQ